MIPVIIIAAILLLILLNLLFNYKNKIRYLRNQVSIQKEKHEALKEETILLGLILTRLSVTVKNSIEPLKRNSLPFTVEDTTDIGLDDLTSIRLKKVKEEVLVYLNGAMIPYKGKIKINILNGFNSNNVKDLDSIIETMHKKKFTGINIVENLKEINKNLNR